MLQSDSLELALTIKLRKTLYIYQKICYNSILQERNNYENIFSILDFYKKAYLLNCENLFLNNSNLFQISNFSEIDNFDNLDKKQGLTELTNNEALLILQAINTFNLTITHFSESSIDIIFKKESGKEDVLTIEKYFNEENLTILINFLLNKALMLSPINIFNMRTNPEEYFIENNDSGIDYDLRNSGLELFKSFLLYVNPEGITKIIQNMLENCDFLTDMPNLSFFDVLKKEAIYFVINGLYRELKNDIEFEKWYDILKKELFTLDNK